MSTMVDGVVTGERRRLRLLQGSTFTSNVDRFAIAPLLVPIGLDLRASLAAVAAVASGVLPRLRARPAGVGHRVRPVRAGARDAGRAVAARPWRAPARWSRPTCWRWASPGWSPGPASRASSRPRSSTSATCGPPPPASAPSRRCSRPRPAASPSRRSARVWWPTSSAGGRCRACPRPPRPRSSSRCAGCPSRSARRRRATRCGRCAPCSRRAGAGSCWRSCWPKAPWCSACSPTSRLPCRRSAGPRPSPGSSRRPSGWARWPARGWCGRWSSG